VLFAFVISLIACVPARAAEVLNAGQLYTFCTSTDEAVKTACRFFVLGAVTGISHGDGSTKGRDGTFAERKKTHFCMPDDMPDSEMVDAFVQTVRLLVQCTITASTVTVSLPLGC
jgi:hypothetical protein